MKKKLLTAVLASALTITCLTGCGTKTAETTAAQTEAVTTVAATEAQTTEAATEAQTTEAAAEAQTTEAAEAQTTAAAADANASDDLADYVGTYTEEYDGSELIINEDGTMQLSIFRLTTQDGTVDKIEDGVIYVTMEDASGNEMKGTFTPATNTFEITDSTWEYLANGDTFEFKK